MISRIAGYWKRNAKLSDYVKAALMACLPVLACLVYCAARGRGILEVYLPASAVSDRNDELFYYKQVEAVLRYGYPQGYFGFNESRALQLSFAAWSPVLLLPWVLWGLVFGWNLLSPVICNIFMMTLAMSLFALLAKPTWRQAGIITLLFLLYKPFVWYMLSGMAEISCIALLLVFCGVAAAWLQRGGRSLLAAMFALAGLLTLMRPYMLLFLVLPMYCRSIPGGIWFRGGTACGAGAKATRVDRKGFLGSVLVAGAVLGCYACINHFLAAEYFEPLFYMDWLTAFFEKGLPGGIRHFFGSLYYSGLEFGRYMQQGVRSGLPAGAIFCCYIVMWLVLLWQAGRDFLAVRRLGRQVLPNGCEDVGKSLYQRLVLEAHLAFAFLGMLMAQLLMYNFFDGCRHLLTFLSVGVFVVALMETRYYKKAVLVGLAFFYFFSYRDAGFYAYQAFYAEDSLVEGMEAWEDAAGQYLVLEEAGPNYDNVVIWVYAEELPEGSRYTGWQYLYALPAGFGISCCTAEYVAENFDSLRSRYLCMVPGGSIEERCVRAGYEKIVGNEYAVLYRRP